MAVYGGIQAHELERWLNALTNAAYDRRCPLSKVHGGNARARTARQDLLYIANAFRSGQQSREDNALALGRWCESYLTEAEWYILAGAHHKADTAESAPESLSAEALRQHRVG
ncbi:hypothetical protein LPL18_001380 [Halomonas sp. CUBES01]|uniref:PH domain-containing protein n=1 Tax=Vreelandella gomseomensis TaxID=370766 RepID=A0ABU1GCC6_9GAMM|nr:MULTISPECIES: hypothetical protein [Halomonas]MDR5875139.1 hypothetical protein [Halomonas gomseomensis]MEC4765998.1 hypothetical protein [Halomonas sp. CUBES01]